MKKLVQFGFLVGFVAVAVAGYFLPWISYERYPSATSVIINGGRSEQFLVHLPSDRLYAAGGVQASGDSAGPVADEWPQSPGLPGSAQSRVEHYKLRDVTGNVIGVAARHSTPGPAGLEAAWLLTIPSRGSVIFAGSDGAADAVEGALAAQGWRAGTDFSETVSAARAAELASVHVQGEFSGLELQLTETWEVTGVDAEGVLRGTIQLATTGRRL